MYNTPYNQMIRDKMLNIDKAYINHSRRQRVGTQEILTRDPLLQGGRISQVASALMGGSAVADPAYVASLAGDGVGTYKASGLSGGYMGSLYRPPVPDMYIHGDDPRFEGLGKCSCFADEECKCGGNIGLAQSPESVEYFADKAMKGSGENSLEGGDFMSDFWTGFKMPFQAVGSVLGLGKKGKKGGAIQASPELKALMQQLAKEQLAMKPIGTIGPIGLGKDGASGGANIWDTLQPISDRYGFGKKGRKCGGALTEKEMVMDEQRKEGKLPDISLHGGNFLDTLGDIAGTALKVIPFLGLGKRGDASKLLDKLLESAKLSKSGTLKAKIARLKKKAPELAKALTKEKLSASGMSGGEIQKLEGGNFWDTLGDIGKVALKVAPLALGLGKKGRKGKGISGGLIENSEMPSRIGGAKGADTIVGGANAVMGGVRAKRIEKSSKPACRTGIKDRAEIVRKVMKEKGLSMIEASKYVKQNGLY